MSTDFGMVTLKMLGSLVLIIGLIICLFYLLKRFKLSPLHRSGNYEMRTLGTLNIAPKKSVALIKVCDEWLVIGLGTDTVTLLSKIDPPPEIDDTTINEQRDPANFFHLFQRLKKEKMIGKGTRENEQV